MFAYLIKFIRIKRNEDGDENDDYEENEVRSQKHVILRMIAVILAGVAILLFIFTENMILHMDFMDRWTIWHIFITAGAVVIARLSRKKPEEKMEEEENYMEAM